MLKFGKKTTALLDEAYLGGDIVKRRIANHDAVDPQPGETIVDIGCGNGLLTIELARAVGADGRVIGVDPSEQMRSSAQARCDGRENVEIVDGTADAIPLRDGEADKAVSVQVFEYLADIPAALGEANRILKPGGRLVIGDMHWDSLAWHSEDSARMTRMQEAWDDHFSERRVPALLPEMLHDAGFEVETATPYTILDRSLRRDGMAIMMLHLMSGFAVQNQLMDEDEVAAWKSEQEELARRGSFFFMFTHVVTSARKN